MSILFRNFVFGTSFEDVLDGTAVSDVVFAFGGNDLIQTGFGADYVFAGRGDDTVDAGDGNDKVYAGRGDDDIAGGAGNDLISGGRGFDTVTYVGSVSDYSITTHGANKAYVKSIGTVADAGRDKLKKVEAIYFEADDYTYFLDGSNNAVLAGDDVATTDEDSALTLSAAELLANDQEFDGDTITMTGVDATSAQGAAVSFDGTDVTYDASGLFDALQAGETATDTFEYTVDDGLGGTDTAQVTVTITGVNDGPVLVASDAVVAENTTAVAAGVSATDVDSATLSFSLSGTDAALFDIDAATGAITFLAAPDFEEPGDADADNVYDLTVAVDDNDGAIATQDIAVTVSDVVEVPPAIVITEIMQNPSAVSDSAGEWFEIYNAGDAAIDINGWTISDNDNDSHEIANGGPLVIAPGGYLVLGNNADTGTNGGVTVDYEFSGIAIANGGDELILTTAGGLEVDRVEYDGGPNFPDPNGASMALIDATLDNNVGANWTTSTEAFGDGDLGTPGADNAIPEPEPEGPLLSEGFDYAEDGAAAAFSITDSAGAAAFFAEDTSFDYFGIFDGDADGGADFGTDAAPSSFNSYTNVDDNYLGGSDIDGGSPAIQEPAILTWAGIDITGLSTLEILADLATDDSDTALDFNDFISFEVSVDGGAWEQVMAFETASVDGFNLPTFLQDTDFDGVGDGEALTSAFATFSDEFDVSGSLLDLRVQLRVDAGREDFGLDNIVLQEAGTSEPDLPPVVISEIMQNPNAVFDSAGEWFELSNTGDSDVDINGWVISDNDSDSHTIDNGGPLIIPAGGFVVLGNNGDAGTNGGVSVDYEYAGINLSNGADEIVLTDGAGIEVDRVEYDGGPNFPDPTGASMALTDLTLDNNTGANWAASTEAFGDGDLGTPGASNEGTPPPPPPADVTLISAIQGTGGDSAFVGQQLTVSAIVTHVIDGRGFFLQEEDADADGDLTTSEGIFVFTGGGVAVTLGDLVEVTGTVSEFFGETQLGNVSASTIISSGNVLPTAAQIALDPAVAQDFEAIEGMLVTVSSGTTDPLTVIENFNLDRFGEITVSAGRQTQATQLFDAQTQATEVAEVIEGNLNNRLLLDDGFTVSNPDEFAYLPGGVGDDGDGILDAGDDFADAGTTLRLGSEMTADVTGVLGFGFGEYRLYATEQLQIDEATNSGARTAAPEDVGGDLQIASFNVLNYFTTLDNGSGGSGPSNLQPRGADNAEELVRQQDALVEGMTGTGADVFALQEIENGGFGPGSAGVVLADAMTAANAGTDFQIVDPTTDAGFIGTDAIATGIMYDATKVQLIASDFIVFEESSAATTFALADILNQVASSDDQVGDFQRNRPSVAATFEELDSEGNGTGNVFTVVSSHFKSKGDSNLQDVVDDAQAHVDGGGTTITQADIDALLADPNFDQGNGQGFWNQVRLDGAVELANWVETEYNGGGVTSYVLLGDLNAYAEEDAVQHLDDDAGLVDLIDTYVGQEDAYSFVFDGQQGTLDQGLADATFAGFVTGATEWHINADEPDLLNYDTSFKNADFYNPGVFASSDHDPLIVGLDFSPLDIG